MITKLSKRWQSQTKAQRFLIKAAFATFFIIDMSKEDLSLQVSESKAVVSKAPRIERELDIHYQFISRYKKIAIIEQQRFGIPACVKLAQAIHESQCHTSSLSKKTNNLFGIKCWTKECGENYKDDADTDQFKIYESPEESFRDHTAFLLNSRYQNLFLIDKKDYKGWCRGLKVYGYATDPNYAEKLIRIIEKYNLQNIY